MACCGRSGGCAACCRMTGAHEVRVWEERAEQEHLLGAVVLERSSGRRCACWPLPVAPRFGKLYDTCTSAV
eukprot:1403479-Prymnesium_polylepis.1